MFLCQGQYVVGYAAMINLLIAFLYWVAALLIQLLVFLTAFTNYVSVLTPEQIGAVQYDYIVVGAGSAGSIVASRLAEDGNVSVLLLEAGGRADFWPYSVPIISPLLQLTNQDWQFQTTEQNHACFGLYGNASRWPRGKVVGGTSRLNYMLYVRGHWRDYDSWPLEQTGPWSSSEDLYYFKKSEQQRGKFKDDVYHSCRGYMVVSDVQYSTPLAEAFLGAAEELGFPLRDLNGAAQTGFMAAQVNVNDGRRWSVEDGFLKNHGEKNLKVLSNTFVSEVLFHDNYEAYGVKVMRFGEPFRILAHRAVILSAGVIGTPKILLLSGIGPKEHLKSLQIPVIRDLPVGKNLQDHITTGLDLILLNQSLSLDLFDIASPSSAWQYFQYGKGPWTNPGCEAMGVVHSRLADPERDPPDLQIMALPMGLSSDYGAHMKTAMGLKQEVWQKYFCPLRGHPVASLMPVLLHPKSQGEVKLRSRNVEDAPVINPNYLLEDADVQVLYEGILLVKKLIETESLKRLGAHLNPHNFPGCEDYKFDSPDYWKCYIRHLTLTSYHPVGTCKMGVSYDTSVVDKHLRVHGTNKLFVADASVMPSLPSGNINAAVMMIAERAADLIKLFWHQATENSKKKDIFSDGFCRII